MTTKTMRRPYPSPPITASERGRPGLPQGLTKWLAWALATTALCPLPALAQELPQGGQVAAGAAQIARPAPGQMAITQSSERAVVNWQSFSVGQGGEVRFAQPGPTSATLNRVTGPLGSRIDGTIRANGEVFLVNPSGVVVGPGGRVEAGGFVASSLGISDDDFQAGRLTFSGSGASAGVANQGTISVREGGMVALLGGTVRNTGTITAPLGRVGLGAGERATLDLTGDGFLQVALPSDVEDEVLIEQAGRISADGGRIEISAATARDAARRVVNLSGVTEAQSVSGRSGAIVLGGGPGGTVNVSGPVRAGAPAQIVVDRAKRPPERPEGGRIEITGERIELALGAEIEASAPGGGGTIRIGGDIQGGGTLPRALELSMAREVTVQADATDIGDGGSIVLWADTENTALGHLSARGGPQGGDGGFVEVSSPFGLRFDGSVTTEAPMGATGTFLLDPTDVLICDAAPTCVAGTVPGRYTTEQLEALLASSNITVLTNFPDTDISSPADDLSLGADPGDILVDGALEWAANTTLSFDAFIGPGAFGDITVNAPITAPNGTVTFFGAETFINAPVSALQLEFNNAVTTTAALDASLMEFFPSSSAITFGAPITVADSPAILSSFRGDLRMSSAPGATVVVDAPIDAAGLVELVADTVTVNAPIEGGGIDIEATNGPVLADADLTITPSAFNPPDLFLGGGNGSRLAGDIGGDPNLVDIFMTSGATLDGAMTGAFVFVTGTITAGENASVDADVFRFDGGSWRQIGPLAPIFADDFQIAPGTNFVRAAGGDGSEADPYLIADIYGLQGLTSADFAGEAYELTGDIDASGTDLWYTTPIGLGTNAGGFRPIGGEGDPAFSGILDGAGFTVSGLSTSYESSISGEGVGVFAATNGAEIRDIAFSDVDILGFDADAVGGLVAEAANGTTISGVGVSGFVGLDATGILSPFDSAVGGIVGQLSGGSLTDSAFGGSVVVDNTPFDAFVSAGGLVSASTVNVGGAVGENAGTVDGVVANIALDSAGDAPVNAGGLVGENTFSGSVLGSDAEGSMVLSSTRGAVGGARVGDSVGGLVGANDGVVTDGRTGVSVTVDTGNPVSAGGLVGTNSSSGAISAGLAAGDVTVTDSEGDVYAGGFVGDNRGGISASAGEGDVTVTAPAAASGLALYQVGGFAGFNRPSDPNSILSVTAADGSVSAAGGTGTAVEIAAGGHTGSNLGAIADGYALGSVTVTGGAFVEAGGFVGNQSVIGVSEIGSVTRGLAVGPVSAPAGANVGGFIGGQNGTVTASFYDTETGLPTSPGGGTGLTTGDLQATGPFQTTAAPLGWNFASVWAPGAAGFYPSLYQVDPVIYAIPGEVTQIPYGQTALAPPDGLQPGALRGGPDDFNFGDPGATLDAGAVFGALTTLPLFDAGTPDALPTAAVADSSGQDYVVIYDAAGIEVIQAPIQITLDDQLKDSGDDAFVLDSTAFTVSSGTFVGDDGVDTVGLESPGAEPGAPAGDYAITVSLVDGNPVLTGTGLSNYDFTFVDGVLTVTQDALGVTITFPDVTKVYGEPGFALDPGLAEVSGLDPADSLTDLTIESAGEPEAAEIGRYDIILSDPVVTGPGAGGYAFTLQGGTLTVTEAGLVITPLDQSKTVGETLTFAGTEFRTDGLRVGDTVERVDLSSPGAGAEALVTDSPFPIFAENAVGPRLSNYEISFGTGRLDVRPEETIVVERPALPTGPSIDNPADPPTQIALDRPLAGGSDFAFGTGPAATATGSLEVAETTLATITRASNDLTATAAVCRESEDQVTDFLGCIGTALEAYAAALDPSVLELPEAMETVSASIEVARQGIEGARRRAESRLAGVTDPAARREIERQAVAEARAALDIAEAEVTKALTLIRADDPDLANAYRAQARTVLAAVDAVDLELQRAVGL